MQLNRPLKLAPLVKEKILPNSWPSGWSGYCSPSSREVSGADGVSTDLPFTPGTIGKLIFCAVLPQTVVLIQLYSSNRFSASRIKRYRCYFKKHKTEGRSRQISISLGNWTVLFRTVLLDSTLTINTTCSSTWPYAWIGGLLIINMITPRHRISNAHSCAGRQS